jgi:hypothetical protein
MKRRSSRGSAGREPTDEEVKNAFALWISIIILACLMFGR